jgi:hypothetical protein
LVRRTGGRIVAEAIGSLRKEVENYFGKIAEVKAGAASPKSIPDKPEELILYEQTRTLGVPLFAGGVVDQPHIWMQVYKVIDDTVKVFEAIEQGYSQSRN